MAETAIQWADYTFNPWVGCQRVSPGCEHCYAEAYDKRVGGAPKLQRRDPSKPQLRWGATADRVRTSVALWKQPMRWNKAALQAGTRPRVFCASLADVFDLHESIERTWRLELFSVIRQTPQLDWLLLTKRPENFRVALESSLYASARHNGYMQSEEAFEATRLWVTRWLDGRAPENVLVGTTVEDRLRAARLRHLKQISALGRFVSAEPLLEDLGAIDLEGVSWIIVGGESGAKARRFEVAWARALVARARRAGVAPFVKQLGANVIDRNDAGFEAMTDVVTETGRPVDEGAWPEPHGGVEEHIDGHRDDYQGAPVRVHLRDHAGGDMAEWPFDLRVRQFPEVRRGP